MLSQMLFHFRPPLAYEQSQRIAETASHHQVLSLTFLAYGFLLRQCSSVRSCFVGQTFTLYPKQQFLCADSVIDSISHSIVIPKVKFCKVTVW